MLEQHNKYSLLFQYQQGLLIQLQLVVEAQEQHFQLQQEALVEVLEVTPCLVLLLQTEEAGAEIMTKLETTGAREVVVLRLEVGLEPVDLAILRPHLHHKGTMAAQMECSHLHSHPVVEVDLTLLAATAVQQHRERGVLGLHPLLQVRR